ncbi:MAG TPA: Clp protease N-terminal domain-containing protein [Ktedonobacteraceae bacterium]|jgi:hypothetical protein
MSNGDKFDKFAVQAKRVMSYAQEEAQRLQHNYIGTEHLLLGLTREGEGVAARVLKNDFGIELNKARSVAESLIGRGEHAAQGEIELPPTSVATTVPEKDPVRPCRVCGSPAPYDFNYCFHCGSELKPKGQGSHIFNYCFHCGAKMKSEEQEES